MVENLASSMKLLQAQTTELAKLCGTHEERIKNLTTANAELVKKNATLETRMMAKYACSPLLSSPPIPLPFTTSRSLLSQSPHRALQTIPPTHPQAIPFANPRSSSEHNNTARLQNSHLPRLSHTPLVPLHDLGTNRPIRHFPKHEKDIKIMNPAEVVQVLQALDIKTMGMSQAERKQELRAQTGLPGESIIRAEGSGT